MLLPKAWEKGRICYFLLKGKGICLQFFFLMQKYGFLLIARKYHEGFLNEIT